MCGITGAYAFNSYGETFLGKVRNCVDALQKRGPDDKGLFLHKKVALGHTRLSVIDTSKAGNQPFTDHSGRFTIVFNGEFFNFQEYREKFLKQGIPLKSGTDTEVLLYLYIKEGPKCLDRINGFFAFAIYDREEDSLFMARDRMGIKPLFYSLNADRLIFASEMKGIMAAGVPKELDQVSLLTFFRLNYIPAPNTIFVGVNKLEPGHFLFVRNNEASIQKYYEIPVSGAGSNLAYGPSIKKLQVLLEDAVQKRLVADVPLGTFLSGGIDSSVITALAARHKPNLNTFSIGFRDEPMFDETHYARLVAKKLKTNHTEFKLTNQDLFSHLFDVLNYIDEPFADSSALNVFILSKETRKHVTVALSGDGADELFAGYHKHMAEFRARQGGFASSIIKHTGWLWEMLPKSRNGKLSNLARQFEKFSRGLNLREKDRYWEWASLMGEEEASSLFIKNPDLDRFRERKTELLRHINAKGGFNEVLYTDMKLVLPNDMLTKVDLMSMANSLEVRVPFLDHRLVEFAFSLPPEFKINGKMKKRILQDAFRDMLPPELYNRPKKGFEVPLLKWFRTELRELIVEDLLSETFIKEQGIFKSEAIKGILNKLFSNNPGDAVANVWALIVFQYWWKKHMA